MRDVITKAPVKIDYFYGIRLYRMLFHPREQSSNAPTHCRKITRTTLKYKEIY